MLFFKCLLPNGFPRRSQMYLEMIPHGPGWSQTVPDDRRWPQMMPNASTKWSQMIPNEPRWFHRIRNPSESLVDWPIADTFSQMPSPSCVPLNNRTIVWAFTLGLFFGPFCIMCYQMYMTLCDCDVLNSIQVNMITPNWIIFDYTGTFFFSQLSCASCSFSNIVFHQTHVFGGFFGFQ